MFARRLDESCSISVKELNQEICCWPDAPLFVPAAAISRSSGLPLGDVVVLSDDPRVNGHRPSADVLFRSPGGRIWSQVHRRDS